MSESNLTDKTCITCSGGGVLGVAHAGALYRLFELGGLKTIKNVVGTSVGSIIAAALACGADRDYIKEKLFNLDLKRFKDKSNLVANIFRFLFRYGWYKGNQIEIFAGEILEELAGNSDITFKEIHEKFDVHLTITYLSMRYKKTKYADHITMPDLQVKKAIRMSSSIPYFYRAPRILNDFVVDGGVTDNYPLHVLREQGCSPSSILGFRLCSDIELDEYKAIKEDEEFEKDYGLYRNIKDHTFRLVEILREQALRYHVHKDDWKLTCKIDIGKYKVTDFDITDEDKDWLFNQGIKAINQYIDELE